MIANYAIIYKNVYMKKEHTRKNNNKNIIIAVLIAIAALIAMWFAFGRTMYWKSQDFNKFSGKIEQCKYVGANMTMYKSTDKDGKIMLTGERGEYMPCVTGDNEQGQMCEGLLTSLSDCKVVFDNKSSTQVYDKVVHDKILDYIAANKIQDAKFREDLAAKEAANYTGVRYASDDGKITFTLETEKGLQGGKFTLNDNGTERKGEWVGTEGNKNVIVLLDNIETMDKLTIKGTTLLYKDKILNIVKK